MSDEIKAAADLEEAAQMLYRAWASAARNPEPWWNIMPAAMKGWREVAKLYLQAKTECPDCGAELECSTCTIPQNS